ncbi:MAG: hypothetical protein DHS20C18_06080 [Saprospiraceae bacterium]|nr:MAG: hypothetical protein DHS20C18_06080 [Saprospiraceae bacterium]
MDIKKIGLVLLMLLSFIWAPAQEEVSAEQTAIEQEVNQQLWKPFKVAWEARNWEAFNALHTDDVMRISKWSGIQLGDEYKESIKASYQKKDDRKKTIDFWLEHRIYRENMGYEVGYYRISSEEPGKEIRNYYARFHIVLKKVNGQWKIAQDWDTNNINGVPVTEEDFAKGKVLEY